MDEAELQTHARLLEEVVDVYSVLIDADVVPNTRSLAARELHDARNLLSDVGVGGEGPVHRVYATAAMCYTAALDLTRAIVVLMTGQFSIVPAAVLARSVAEVASQAWWLLDPGIGCVRRVRRMQAIRYRSALEGERAAKADGAAPGEYHLYTETTDEVKEYSRLLGLEAPSQHGFTYVCGEERLPTASRRVVAMFDDLDVPSVYNLCSGFPHGELFALRQGFSPSSNRSGLIHFRPALNNDAVKNVVAVASWALHAPGSRLTRLYGLDESAAPRPI